MFIGLPLPSFKRRHPGQGGAIAPPPLVAHVTGDSGGLVLPGALLRGTVTGVPDGAIVQDRWLADGGVVAGATGPELVPLPGGNVPAEAGLRYAPLVDGVELLSREVQLTPEISAGVSGDTAGFLLPGSTLTGSVSGGLPGQAVQHGWLANDAAIAGATEPLLIAEPGVTVPAEAVIRYAPEVGGTPYQSRDIQLTPPVTATVSGAINGEVLPEQTLTGVVSGGLPSQVIAHFWSADGQEIAGETSATLTPVAGGNVPAGALLRYTPLVDGSPYLSDAVQLVPAISVTISGDVAGAVLPGGMLTGLISGGLSGQGVQHRWTADGTEIAGETGPQLVPEPGGNVPADAVLRYAPVIDGVGYVSDAIALIPPPVASISGAINGEIQPDQTLIGQISGGLAGQVVQHGWLADGAPLTGATEATLDLAQHSSLPVGTQLRYAPWVGGLQVVSTPVQIALPPVVTWIFDLTGAGSFIQQRPAPRPVIETLTLGGHAAVIGRAA